MLAMAEDRYLLQTCKACVHEFRVPMSLRGRTVLCPYCGAKINIGAATPDKPVDKLVGQVIRGCRLDKRLGAGAMGAVYEAWYIKGERKVAIKLLSSKAAEIPEVIQRFIREAELCKALDHDNIIKVFDYGEERGVHYIVMEVVEGTTLSGVIEDADHLPWRQACGIIRSMASALAHAGEKDIIHRDIKPANILIRNDGEAKLADLGLGKQLSAETSPEFALTMQGATMGTPAYMPPEQIADASSVDQSADVYSLGATFYHAVTGRRPFEGSNAAEIMNKLRHEEAPEPRSLVPEIPVGINDLIMQMLEKIPEDRPQHANDLIAEIDKTLANPEQARQRRRGKARRGGQNQQSGGGKGLLIIVILVLLAGAAAAAAKFMGVF